MVNINLNLIAPEQKECLRLTQAFSYIKILTFIFLSFAVVTAGLLLVARLILQDNLGDILSSSTSVNDRNLNIDREISKLNKKVEDINKIQSSYTKWSSLLGQLMKTIPANIEITYLSFEKKTGVFTLSGRAKQRQDFLNLKNTLEQTSYLEKVTSPINNLLTKTNVEFQFTGKLKLTNGVTKK